jgi:hypothetical protein
MRLVPGVLVGGESNDGQVLPVVRPVVGALIGVPSIVIPGGQPTG